MNSTDQDLFDEVKLEADPEQLLNEYGVEFENESKYLVSPCPLPGHQSDEDPSFKFKYKETPPLFYCHGCHRGGSVVDFVAMMDGVDNITAARKLAEIFNIDIAITPDQREEIRERNRKLDIIEVFTEACHNYLMEGKENPDSKIGTIYHQLLNQRFINERVIKQARIGFGGSYDPKTRDAILERMIKNHDVNKEDALELGIFWKYCGDYRNMFTGYYTMPYISKTNKVRYMTGRLYEDPNGQTERPEDLGDGPSPKYMQLPGSLDYHDQSQIYNELVAFQDLGHEDYRDDLFIVEGQFDALALSRLHYPAVAISGTGNTSTYIDQIANLVNRTSQEVNNVYIAMDREDTSKLFTAEKSTQQAFELAENLSYEGINPKIVELPSELTKFEDVDMQNEIIVDEIDVDEALKFQDTITTASGESKEIDGVDIFNQAVVEDSQTLIEHKFDEIKNEQDKQAKAEIVKDTLKIIAKYDPLVQSQYVKDLNKIDKAFNISDLKSMLQDYMSEDEEETRYNKYEKDISDKIHDLQERYSSDKSLAYKKIAELVIKKLKNYGRNKNAPNIFFFSEDYNRTYVLYDGDFVEVDRNNKKFQAMLSDFAGGALNTTRPRGKAVVEELTAYAINNGEPIQDISWSDTITDTNAEGEVEDLRLYFPLANQHNELIKLTGNDDGPEITSNAVNEDNVIVRSVSHMNDWEYNDDVDIEETMKTVRDVIWNKMAVPPEYRMFILSSMFAMPMLDVLGNIAHVRFQAKTNTGKSQIGKIITTALLGEDRISSSTEASLRTLLENSPIVCMDEFEREHFDSSTMKLLRIAVSRGEYNKMSKTNETEIITQPLRAMVYSTGIDRLKASENRNRTFVVRLDKSYYADEFSIERIKRKIKKFRNDILSAMMKITNDKIIPQYLGETEPDGESLFYKIKRRLNRRWGQHPLNRLFGFLSLMGMYTKELSKYMPEINNAEYMGSNPPEKGTKEYMNNVMDMWLGRQSQLAWQCMSRNSNIITLLDSLKVKFETAKRQIMEGFGRAGDEYTDASQYMIENFNAKVTQEENEDGEEMILIEGTINEIYQAIQMAARDSNMECNYQEPGHLFERLKNDEQVLSKQGWFFEVEGEDNTENGDYKENTTLKIKKQLGKSFE